MNKIPELDEATKDWAMAAEKAKKTKEQEAVQEEYRLRQLIERLSRFT